MIILEDVLGINLYKAVGSIFVVTVSRNIAKLIGLIYL